MGIEMLWHQDSIGVLRFPNSHFMLLGWVSMMIYGVGYHILPRFAGKLITQKSLAEAHVWIANAGLLGMAVFYVLRGYNPGVGLYTGLLVLSGVAEAAGICIFFYLMMVTVYKKDAQPAG
jgi:cytochrome c oxidase cbb3-type subunit 1